MLMAYLECIKVSYRSNLVFKTEFLMTIVNSVFSILVGISIWKAIYHGAQSIDRIGIQDVTSYIVIVFALQSVFAMDEFILDRKIKTGAIATDLIRPIEMRSAIFFQTLGTLLFKASTQLLPVLVVATLFFGFKLPSSPQLLASFLLSCSLGYLVLYYLNQIFWSVSFWIHVTWSVITIKDALLMLFSGVLFPIWYMPQPVRSLMRYTPFESIYYLPISIYTGKLDACGVAQALLLQVLWGGGLYLLGRLLWNRGLQRISIQGG